MDDTYPWPPLTRGLSAEQADWGREMFFSFLSLRLPFGQPPPKIPYFKISPIFDKF